MAIETLEDWNAILGQCCCEMPSCPVPVMECEYKNGEKELTAYYPIAQPAGISGEDEIPRLYKSYDTQTDTYLNGRAVRFSSAMVEETPPYEGWEYKWIGVFTATSEADQSATYSGTHNYYDPPGTCVSEADSTYAPTFEGNPYVESTECSLTETEKNYRWILTYQSGGVEPNLVGCPGPFSGTGDEEWWDGYTTHKTVDSVEEPFTKADLRGEAIGELAAEWAAGGGCSASLDFSHGIPLSIPRWPLSSDHFPDGEWPACEDSPVIFGVGVGCYVAEARFKWVIPETWTGSYFKVTWDVAFFPTVGDPVAVSTDNTWEWAGPGDPEDPETWKSGHYIIPIPDEPGENRPVNIRFECYRSPAFGNKPQVTGEAVDLPP